MAFKLIVDFEATCTNKNEFPKGDCEIIEIGAIIFDEDWVERSRFQRFVKPVKHVMLTDFCKELTTIQQSDVDDADIFEVVIPQFQEWVDETVGRNDYKFYSWGAFDKNILKRQCDELDVKNINMINYHANMKEIFAKHYGIKQMGVGKALKFKNMKFHGTQHRALDDVFNISRLARRIDKV